MASILCAFWLVMRTLTSLHAGGLSSPGVRLLAAALAAGQSHASMQSATEAARREAQAAKALILKVCVCVCVYRGV